jgi:hypothetical protein
MAYGQQMTPEERMMAMLMQRQKDPYGITTQGQVQKELEQLDPRNLEAAGGMSMPPPPDLSSSPEQDALSRMTRSTGGMESRLKSQQAYADSLRATPGAKLQRVGPSNIAVANPWEGLEVGFNRALGGYLSSKLGDDYDAVDAAKTDKARATAEYEASLLKDERAYTTGQNDQDRGLRQAIANMRDATTQSGQRMTAETAAANIDAAAARDAAAVAARREEAVKDDNYLLDGRVVNIVKDAQNRPFLGGLNGVPLDAETFSRAVQYRPGTEKGTLADESSFQMPLVDQIAPEQSLFSGVFTSPYFDKSTGAFNFERWAGALAVGPDGSMVQATQSDMATMTLGPMAVRMEEINLRPWTEKEIETITRDFPGPNSKYPDWARFGARVIIPKMEARFAEAISRDRSDDIMREKVIGQMYSEVIEGWSRNASGRSFKDLEQLGVPAARIKAYLREKEKRGK